MGLVSQVFMLVIQGQVTLISFWTQYCFSLVSTYLHQMGKQLGECAERIELTVAAPHQVTATIGSVFRSVLLTTRTALVWLVDLILFYTGLGGGVVGEELNRFGLCRALLGAIPPPPVGKVQLQLAAHED